MKFTKCQITLARRPRTKRQVANLTKSVKKEANDVSLFPSLRRFTTEKQRAEQLDAEQTAWAAQHRKHVADAWRRARAILRTHPEPAMILYRFASCPLTSNYLLDILHDDSKTRSVEGQRDSEKSAKFGK